MHSATKYLCGHGDVSAGVLVGDERRIKAVWEKAYLLGATLDPFAARWCCGPAYAAHAGRAPE